MSQEDTKNKIAELSQILTEASHAYYIEDNPIMSDAEYDRLRQPYSQESDDES